MDAKEARAIADKKRKPFEEIIQQIENSANSGNYSTVFMYLNHDEIIQLVELGFKLSKGSYPTGETFAIVQW